MYYDKKVIFTSYTATKYYLTPVSLIILENENRWELVVGRVTS